MQNHFVCLVDFVQNPYKSHEVSIWIMHNIVAHLDLTLLYPALYYMYTILYVKAILVMGMYNQGII